MLRRLPLRPATKAKISKALSGKPKTAEHRAKLSAALKGRPQSPATAAALAAARAASPKTAQDVTRERRVAANKERTDQLRKDMYAAARDVRDLTLLEDVRQSQGWRSKRKLFDTTKRVSDGYGKPRRRRLEDIRLDTYFQAQEYAYGIPRNRP